MQTYEMVSPKQTRQCCIINIYSFSWSGSNLHETLLLQVDKHIRRLDADLARFENELKEKLEVSGYESTEGRGLKSKSGH